MIVAYYYHTNYFDFSEIYNNRQLHPPPTHPQTRISATILFAQSKTIIFKSIRKNSILINHSMNYKYKKTEKFQLKLTNCL